MDQITKVTLSGDRGRAPHDDQTGSACLQAAVRLHAYIEDNHWNGQAIVGPDPIGKVHWRVTRFVRSYLPWLPGDDRFLYLQAQGYWIRANLTIYELTGDPRYLEFADQCANALVKNQPENGAWLHPPIWGRRGFVSTVEGVWGSLGLTAAYKKTKKQAYLDSVLKWYQSQVNSIGFQIVGDGLAANYYSHTNYMVPNVTTMLLVLMAELFDLTQDRQYLKYTERLIRFVANTQLESGELPYLFPSRPHFMCYQYNSFQFLDLASYHDLVGDGRVLPLMNKLAQYLSGGLTKQGSCKYSCFRDFPEVNYWTTALATALYRADQLGLGEYEAISSKAYDRVLSRERLHGGFDFSDKNYRFLHDARSYPRYLAMIVYHLSYRGKASILDKQD